MTKKVELESKLRMKIVVAYKPADGYTTHCKRLIVPTSIIRIIIKKYNETHCVDHQVKTERKRLLCDRMKWKCFRDVPKNTHLTTKGIVNDIQASKFIYR